MRVDLGLDFAFFLGLDSAGDFRYLVGECVCDLEETLVGVSKIVSG